jgi:chromosome partitioning protein
MKRTELEFNRMAKVHMVFSQKGGVGKTTLAVNLSATVGQVIRSSPARPSILLVSIDPQGSAVSWSDSIDPSVLPYDYEQMDDHPDKVGELDKEPYDHVFIDAPGSLARPKVLTKALECATDVLVPVVPEGMCEEPTEKTIRDFVEPRGLPYRCVRTIWDPRDGSKSLDEITKFLDEKKFVYAQTIVRKFRLHARGKKEGMIVTTYPKGRAATEARNDLLALALECGYGGQVAA